MSKNNKLFYSYLAGLIDGEGCLGLYKTRKARSKRGYGWELSLTIGNSSRTLIKFLSKKLKTNYYIQERSQYYNPNKKYRKYLTIKLTGDKLKNLLFNIGPYLIEKEKAAKIMQKALKIWFPKEITNNNQKCKLFDNLERKIIPLARKLKKLKTKATSSHGRPITIKS